MNIRKHSLQFLMATCVFGASAGVALAERPMVVDDAGTLERGGSKLEFGWSKDDKARGMDGAVGYGPIDNVEVEFGFGRVRDRGVSPTDTVKAIGAALKWVPLQSEMGLSAGLKLEYANEDSKRAEDVRLQALTGLLTWAFEAGPLLHVNLGHEWTDVDGGEDEDVGTWGIGLDVPLTARLSFTLETFGAEAVRPDRQVGLRYEIAEGLMVSGAIGRGNDRSVASLGVAWEF